jgi:hypothetical protein
MQNLNETLGQCSDEDCEMCRLGREADKRHRLKKVEKKNRSADVDSDVDEPFSRSDSRLMVGVP